MRSEIFGILRLRIISHQPFLHASSFAFPPHFSVQHCPIVSIRRRFFCCCSSSTKGKQMRNPLDMDTYDVEAETYRRNCPLDKVSTAAPAVGVTFGATLDEADCGVVEEDEQTLSPTSSGRSSSSEIRPADVADSDCESPGKRVCVSSSRTTATSATITAEVAREVGEVSTSAPLIVTRKTVEVVSAEDGWVYTENVTDAKALVGTVRYDEKEQHFYDSLRLPTSLVGMIRGRNGNKQLKIEEENRCRIYFPKKQKEGSETEIKFTSTESALHVQSCGEALHKALADARRSAGPTHFISVPIFDTKLRDQYTEFVDKICNDEALPSELRNKSMFMTPSKLHLTLNVLKLFTDEEVQTVRDFLNRQFQSDKIREILRGTDGRLRIEFKALRHMDRQSASACRIVFAQPEAECLQRLVNALDDALTEAGLVRKREGDDVLLHMTVLNTKYLGQGWKTIDATQILERYGHLDFDAIDVKELHLCEMRGNSNPDDVNGYVSVHSIKFATIL